MNRVVRQSNRAGFTLVELLMAMTFVSMLMLGIAVTVIQISNIYNKGLTMRAVDQAGRAISQDIRQTLAGAEPFNIDTAFHEQSDQGFTYGGRLCTGTYSYIWNYGRALSSENQQAKKNEYDSAGDPIRFIRVRDNGGQYCAAGNIDNKIRKEDNPIELLAAGAEDLALQSFKITQLANDPSLGQALYHVVVEIGTNNQSTLQQEQTLTTLDTSCRPPSDNSALQEFCAVNQFDFTVQVGNKGVQ